MKLAQASSVFSQQIEELMSVRDRLDEGFLAAVNIFLNTRGRVVVVGMGKSGLIGRKIAATLASTGTPSFFVHPGEAFHGDLGMIEPVDTVLMISNSGETEELIKLLPFLLHQSNPIIAMTGGMQSTLAKHASVVLDVAVSKETCPNNLAPTSSTTATLVMGDALASVLVNERDFQPEDFARFHPGGRLGRRLLTRVCDVMHKDQLPTCTPAAGFMDVVSVITEGRVGMALVMENGALHGVITDGDLRRSMVTGQAMTHTARDIMTSSPLMIAGETRLVEAEEIMHQAKVNSLVVIQQGKVVGILQIYDI
ncbi:KpsF/GutQ family sugar-phosphate isomerase [Vogesella indigofera]|uniref:KpsF/GutQ family sugar-phosphate isomerase n=1 Tax=Vogesella indigofera TaxID=45465 RepID=UPI00234F4D51|nr:KpsF/GutQ family sugar-phosphate isomerase [Vogesella indigofera]MDC7710854.1 KpsF/GutQ family sugar-phosphate isomerase [Vogesella indigofera]